MDSAPKLNGGGNSSKQGGAATNSRFPPPSSHHSLGGSASLNTPRGKAALAAAAPPSAEETFSLVSGGNSQAFSMIIKLTPSLLEEIKRVEAEDGKARMKFDSNPYNSSGNIIEVGGKEFRFIWSREFGDLCDIYEERKSGEDGNGLLVESGCAWRKLNVQRVLDESTKNHVKRRSEEAERNLKSRRAIVLEPGNPSMNSQMKALAAAEGNSATMRKNYNKRKEAARKKRNVKSFQETATRGGHSSSFSFPPAQPTASSSPLEAANISKSINDAFPPQLIGKQDINAVPSMTFNAMRDTPRNQGSNIAKPIDLQSMLISLLKNKPNGLTLKALVKAVQDIVPNPLRKIKLILRNIARYKSPGRYILRPGVDSESLNKPQNESGSSADNNHGQEPAHQEFCDRSVSLGGFRERAAIFDLEKRVQLNSNVEEESNAPEQINVQHASPYVFGGEKGFDHSKGHGGGTSDGESGSSSQSDGGDSGSNSESDASFNSKEGLDEDVDIMTIDEEKESKHKTEASYQNVPSTIPVRSPPMGVQVRESTHSYNSIGLESLGKSPAAASDRRGTRLQRDLSDFESGKSVKSAPDETQLGKQLERTITVNPAENRASTSLEKGKSKSDNAEMEFLTTMSKRNYEFREEAKPKAANAEMEFLDTLSERNYGSGAPEFGVNRAVELELRGENNTRVDRGKDPRAVDKNNGDQIGESYLDEARYLKYEKDEPVLKGRIWTYGQFKDYVREFNEKYKDYISLNNNLTTYSDGFQHLSDQVIEAKRNVDVAAFNYYLGRIKESYELRGAMHKRLKMVFVVLHEELAHLKQMMADYMESHKRK